MITIYVGVEHASIREKRSIYGRKISARASGYATTRDEKFSMSGGVCLAILPRHSIGQMRPSTVTTFHRLSVYKENSVRGQLTALHSLPSPLTRGKGGYCGMPSCAMVI